MAATNSPTTGAGEGKADRDFEIAEHPGRDRRQVDVPHQRPAAATERHDALDELAVHLPDSGEHGEEDQHRHENEGQRNLGGQPDAEPDHEKRREDHARDGVEERHHRLEQLRDEPDECRDDAEQNANDDAERKTAERGGEGCIEMRPDAAVREQVDERRSNPAGVRHIHWIEHVGTAGRLPDREQNRECGKLAYPGIAGLAEHQAASARRSTSRERSAHSLS